MSNLPAGPDRENMRASDSDRERVAEVLREAAGDGRLSMEELDQRLDALWAAKTYGQLAPIIADLPHSGTPAAPAPARSPAAEVRQYGGDPTSTNAIAVLGGFSRKGDWVVPPHFTAVAILGGGEIDLREARFAERVTRIHTVAIMGGIQIIVPEDASVTVNGIGLMGGFDHAGADAGGGDADDSPRIVIDGIAFWGGVQVERKPPNRGKALKGDARQGLGAGNRAGETG